MVRPEDQNKKDAQARLDQEHLDNLKSDADQRIQNAADLAAANSREASFDIEPEEPEQEAIDLQDLQIRQQEQGRYGNQSGTQGASTQKRQLRDEEENRNRAEQTTAGISVATYTVEEAVKILDNIAERQEQQSIELVKIDLRDQEIEAKVDATLARLDALGEYPDTQDNLKNSLEYVETGLKNQLLENRAQKQELVTNRNKAIEERDALRTSIEQRGGKTSEEEAQRLKALNDEIDNIDEKISQYGIKQQRIDDQVTFIENVNADSSLTDAQKANLNNTLTQTSLKGYFSDTTVLQTTPGELGTEDGHFLYIGLRTQMASLDPNSPRTEELYKLMSESGFKFQTRDGQLLEGQAAIDALRADIEADRLTIIKDNIEFAVDEIINCSDNKISRAELSNIYANNGATPEIIEEIEKYLKEEDVIIAEYKKGDSPIETDIAINTSSTGDASAIESPAPKADVEEMAFAGKVENLIEGDAITQEDLSRALDGAPDHVQTKVMASLQEKGIEVTDPNNVGIKNVVANEVGQDNANIMDGATRTATIAAFPFLAFSGQSIEETTTPTKTCSGINVGCFADSEEFAKYNPKDGSSPSYAEPINNGAEAAPGHLGDKLYTAATNEGEGTGSGGDGTALDQETELRLAAQAQSAEMARLRLIEQNEINRPDLNSPENKLV